MNSKEALDYIRHTDEWKDYYSIERELDIIEKDLEVLEILKSMLTVKKGSTWYYLDTKHPFLRNKKILIK